MCTAFQVSVYIKIHSFLIDIVYCMYVHIPFSQCSTKVNLNRFQCLLKTKLKQKLQHVFFYFKKKNFQVINFVEPFLRIVGSKSLWHFYKNWLEAWRVGHSVAFDPLWHHGLYPTKFLCPWVSPGRNTGVSSHSLLQGIFPTQGSNSDLLYCRQILYLLSHQGSLFQDIHLSKLLLPILSNISVLKLCFSNLLLLLLLSRFSRVWLCVTPSMAAHKAPPSRDPPGKNTGVGCLFLLQCMHAC